MRARTHSSISKRMYGDTPSSRIVTTDTMASLPLRWRWSLAPLTRSDGGSNVTLRPSRANSREKKPLTDRSSGR